MPEDFQYFIDSRILVNRLTVGEARKLIRHEGGELGTRAAILRIGTTLTTAALTARAIAVGDATVWHLLLPLLAQYAALLIAIPILQAVFRLKGLDVEVWKCFGNVAVIAVIAAAVVFYQAASSGGTFQDLLRHDSTLIVNWIVDHKMHWPMLSAFLGFAVTLPGRFRSYREHGPPFASVSFGCATQVLIMFLGAFLLPIIIHNPSSTVWILWGLLLLAELAAAVALWDVQRRLKKL